MDLDSELHMLTVKQVFLLFVLSVKTNKPYDISSPCTDYDIFRQMKMLGKRFKRM